MRRDIEGSRHSDGDVRADIRQVYETQDIFRSALAIAYWASRGR